MSNSGWIGWRVTSMSAQGSGLAATKAGTVLIV